MCSRMSAVILLALLAASVGGVGDQPTAKISSQRGDHEKEDGVGPKGKDDALREAVESVTVAELNSSHMAMLDGIIDQLPAALDLSLHNQGAVLRTGPHRLREEGLLITRGRRVKGDEGKPLHWDIVHEDISVVFTIWMSLRQTDETVASLPGKDRRLFLNVQGASPAMFAEARPKLGGRSITDVFVLLQKHIPAK